MIQELFGGSSGLLNRPSPSPSPSPSSSTTITTTAAATDTATIPNPTTSDVQKLRCPRCDSSNTKFCYYNNYNLTQPRHFCKTCRRYWTKGGALRNVPIGGGCRKNKGTTIATAVGKPMISATGKLKAVVSSELIGNMKSGNFINGFEHEFNLNPNPILWSGPPQTSHLLSLLRATQNPNPNFTSNIPVSHSHMKDQAFIVGSNIGNQLGFELPGLGQSQTSSLGLCSSLWRNNNNQHNHHEQQQQQQQQQQGMNIMRSSSYPGNYFHHDHQTMGGNVGNTSSNSSACTPTILDSAPVIAGGEIGFWNQTIPWSDLAAAANGAYPA